MNHADHFLTRLDRLEGRHIEEALLLYNNPPLLRSILELARVPERVERVALALDEGGPYVLITRDGRFVTCLAAGMIVDDAPIISRKQLEGFASKAGDLQARLALAKELVGTDKRGARKLIGRLTSAGADLSREEFAALVLWQPLLLRELFQCLFEIVEALPRMRESLEKTRLGKDSRKVERALHDYWDAYWFVGHLSLLISTGGAGVFDYMPDELRENARKMFSWGSVRQGGVGLALRGAWAVGRIGKTMLPTAKRRVREARTPLQFLSGALPLIALAMRHTGLRAEAIKALGGALPEDAFDGVEPLQEALRVLFDDAFERPEETTTWIRMFAEDSLAARRKVQRKAPIALPESLQLPVICLDISHFSHQKPDVILCFPGLLTRMSRLSAEELYLPRAALSDFGYGPWKPDFTRVVLRPLVDTSPPKATPPSAPTPGRNDPCACGSGKKFKKCCAA